MEAFERFLTQIPSAPQPLPQISAAVGSNPNYAESTSFAALRVRLNYYRVRVDNWTEAVLLFFQDAAGWIRIGIIEGKSMKQMVVKERIVQARKNTPLAVVGKCLDKEIDDLHTTWSAYWTVGRLVCLSLGGLLIYCADASLLH